MKLTAPQAALKVSPEPKRRGVLAAWTIWTMLAAGVIAAGLFNLIWLSAVRSQAHNCAASAALAAGHSYLSDDMLRSRQQPFEYEGRAARCQQAAVSLAEQYRKGTALPPVLTEEVQVEWPEALGPPSDPAMLVPSGITVSFGSHQDADQIPSFFSGLTGIQSMRLAVKCGVSLEHSPVAFRPSTNGSVPMLPFAICDEILPVDGEQSSSSTGYWTSSIESGKGPDSYSWDSENHRFESGPDGLPEITVTIYSSTSVGSADAFIPMSFSASRSGGAESNWPTWIQNGLTRKDLETLGRNDVSFPGSMPAAAPGLHEFRSIAAELQRKSGDPCLVCLCTASTSNSGSLSLKRPVAVRIIRATSGESGSIKVILQPCILTTATAVTSRTPETALNRYVYSVRLRN